MKLSRPIKLRMTEAKANMIALRRIPRAFYLRPADFAEFLSTKPRKVQALYRNKPREEYGFDFVPVRAALGDPAKAESRLFCSHGTSVQVRVK
jgi:hypothetical protein